MESNTTYTDEANLNTTLETITESDSSSKYIVDLTKLSVLATIIILTILGNGLILGLLLKRPESTNTRVYYYMFHLSIADVITAFTTLLPEFIWTVTAPNFYGGNMVCKIVKFLQMIGPYLSSYVLTMTAVDRYQAICYPLTNQVWTSSKQHYMIISAWIISLLLCIPQAFIFSGHPDRPTCSASFEPGWGVKAYVTWFSVSNFFVPLVVLIFCNACIIFTIWKTLASSSAAPAITINLGQSLETADSANSQDLELEKSPTTASSSFVENNGHHHQNGNGSEKTTKRNFLSFGGQKASKTSTASESLLRRPRRSRPRARGHIEDDNTGISRAKMRSVQQTVVIILMYIACSTPFIFAQLWIVWGRPSQAVINSMVWLFWLLTLNSVVNPWIYLAFNRELRNPIMKFFGKMSPTATATSQPL